MMQTPNIGVQDLIAPLLERLENKTVWLMKLRARYKANKLPTLEWAMERDDIRADQARVLKQIKQLRSALRALGYNPGKVGRANIECLLPAYRIAIEAPAIKHMHSMLDRACAVIVHNHLLESDEGAVLSHPYSITVESEGFYLQGSNESGDDVSGTVSFETVERFEKTTPKHAGFERASNPDTDGAFYDF